MSRPAGTVTFLFTDIEGSTRRWEADPEAMAAALADHDEVLRAAIEMRGGWLFKHTGDGVCAAFASADDAVDAAVDAQRRVRLPVRMGIASGEAKPRGDDYFGPALNRTARVMAAGHGGQILVGGSTAALVHAAELIDLGEHRLRDLSGATRLFQVAAFGLAGEFPPLRTVDARPGNLPAQVTSFVGRDAEVRELVGIVRGHRLVTLTGVGGVGKTRLGLQVAAELVGDFPDGVWLVELGPVGDPAAVPDAVASVLSVTPEAGSTLTDCIARALPGRRLLLVLDNCEHLLDAAADLVELVLTRTTGVHVLATSREGLHAPAERVWLVPPLDVERGEASAAVELFVERARAADATFELGGEEEAESVTEICRRLDGIALAIELAAARMVSMTAEDVRDRLHERFRLLSGARRGLPHHQTLRQAVKWSYDLLDDAERAVLGGCSVFADGFDLAAAASVCGERDEYEVLDRLDALVRKSLVTVDRVGGHARYAMLETIRQFAQDQVAATGALDELRDRHACWFAETAIARWDRMWNGPGYRAAVDWVDVEFANLRAGFRWAADRGEVAVAADIAAHTTMLAFVLQRAEPVAWAEEILPAARAAALPQLPRLYSAASLCTYSGRAEAGLDYAQAALVLEADPAYEPFELGWSGFYEAIASRFTGRIDRYVEIAADLIREPGLAHEIGLCALIFALPALGRWDEAAAIAEETVSLARARGNPFMIAWALNGYGRAFTETDPERALGALREALAYTRQHRVPFWEVNVARDAAGLEALHGERTEALAMFDTTIDAFHRTGNIGHLAATLGSLAVFFDRIGRPQTAATIYGSATRYPSINMVISLPAAVEHLGATLGDDTFDASVKAGALMDIADAVDHARQQIAAARGQVLDVS